MAESPWRIHGLSVEGYRHRRTGTPCQDACTYTASASVSVLAVADGAGSRPHSDQGALHAVELAAEHCRRRAAAAGVSGFLLKGVPAATLIGAVRSAARQAGSRRPG